MSNYSGHAAKINRAETRKASKMETLRRRQIRQRKYAETDLTLLGQAA